MIYRVVSLALCTHLALACIPMLPGEDMPCPSVPLAETVTKYAVNGLDMTVVNGAKIYSCPPGLTLLEVDATGGVTEVPNGKITCFPNSGLFVDEKGMDVKSKTYNCGKEADCKLKCNLNIDNVFDNKGSIYMASLTNTPPTCAYGCDPTENLIFKGMIHERVLCNILTDAFTVDTINGEMVTTTDKFTCMGCQCQSSVGNDGSNGLCPLEKLCIKPPSLTKCTESCEGGTPVYKDMAGNTHTSPSSTIQCLGDKWISADLDNTVGITCQYNEGEGYTTDPPGGSTEPAACAKLPPLQCPAQKACDSSQLVYVKDNDASGGYKVMCKKGTLITDKDPVAEMNALFALCNIWGWQFDIIEANCLTDDEEATMMCAMGLTPNMFESKCGFGKCGIVCKDTTKKLSYDGNDGNGVQIADYFKCEAGYLIPSLGGAEVTDKSLVTCV